jgi:type I restriction-modification system DNA methylase subunit
LKSKKALLAKKDALNNLLNHYRNWLLDIKVLDPACGSGAFLNASLEFLIHEHRRLDEIKAKLLGGSLILSDIENSILENNLYGVDLNDEAIEIAKLSLWLRTARSGRKLSSLNKNIKCGNSLISEPSIANDKAFNWESEFFDVFQNGGFNVVIGNPPYVSANNMSFAEREYFNSSKQYKTLKGKWDLYIPFVEKSLSLLKSEGLLSFIIPYGILNQPFSEGIRKLIMESYQLVGIADLHEMKVFADATVPCCILSVNNVQKRTDDVRIYRYINGGIDNVYDLGFESFKNSQLTMFRTENLNIIEEVKNKIKNVANGTPLGKLYYLSTGAEIHGKESRSENGQLISGHSKFDVLFDEYKPGFKEYIEGSSIPKSIHGRYSIPKRDYYLNYKSDIMRSPKFMELFESPKLMIRGSSGELGILATYDERKLYTPHKITLIINRSALPKNHTEYRPPESDEMNLKYLLAILNSKLMNFYYQSVYGGFIDVYPNYLKALPIPKIEEVAQLKYAVLVDEILQLNLLSTGKRSNFLSLLKLTFPTLAINNKLLSWTEIESKEFINEFKKQKLPLSLSEQSKWLTYFSEEQQAITDLKRLVQNLTTDIDKLVYSLYDITEEEVSLM